MDGGSLLGGAIFTPEEIERAITVLVILVVGAIAVVVALIRIGTRRTIGPFEVAVFAAVGFGIASLLWSEYNSSVGREEVLATFEDVQQVSLVESDLGWPTFVPRGGGQPCPFAVASVGFGSWRQYDLGSRLPDTTLLEAVLLDADRLEQAGWDVQRFVGPRATSLQDDASGWWFTARSSDAMVVFEPEGPRSTSLYRYRAWSLDCDELSAEIAQRPGSAVDEFPAPTPYDREQLWKDSHALADIFPEGQAKAEGPRLVVGLGLDEVCTAVEVKMTQGRYERHPDANEAVARTLQQLAALGVDTHQAEAGHVFEIGDTLATLSLKEYYSENEAVVTHYTPGCGEYTLEAAIDGLRRS